MEKNFVLAMLFIVGMITTTMAQQNALNASAIISLGDSLLDNGNNNNLNVSFSIARANHTPYGRDFDTGVATGRFSNGRIFSDIIAAKLGLPLALAYLDPNAKGKNLTQGINLASGGAGILDSSSAILTPHNLTEQIQWLRNYSQRLQAFEGSANASARIAKALYIINVGSNDFSYKSLNPETQGLTDAQFRALLLSTLSTRIQDIYDIGARKFVISALGPLGCAPVAITLQCGFNASCDRNICNENSNSLAYEFDVALQDTLNTLQNSLPGSKFYFSFDAYNITYQAFKNPSAYGLTVTNRGCCGTGYTEIGDGCNMFSFGTCADASTYLFFDAIHPSTSFTTILANRLYTLLQS